MKCEFDQAGSVTMDGQSASWSDLKEGTKVRVSYEVKDGRNVVSRIESVK